MLRYLVALFMVSQISLAADAVTGKGTFVATNDDSLSFVNEQLKHEGFSDIIGKVLDEMGLNSQLFWQKYNEDFQQAFDRVDSVLKQNYKVEHIQAATSST